MEKKLSKLVQDVWSHKTPDIPKFLFIRPMVESEKISAEDQWEYWLGIGMLMYLFKYLCPDLANATSELSKANNGANPAAYKEILHFIRYMLDTKNLGLKIEPMGNTNKPWEIICFRDSG